MSQIPKDLEDINKRIQKAKDKTKEKDRKDVSSLAVAFQISIELVSGTLVGAGIGYMLDKIFDTKSIMLIIFTIFGNMAGFLNVARYLKCVEKNKKE